MSKFHSGHDCGPCSLCHQKYRYYTHSAAWTEVYRGRLHRIEEEITDSSCICKPCERDIKRNLNRVDYLPRWRGKAAQHCLVQGCRSSTKIIRTSLFSSEQLLSSFNCTPLPEHANTPIAICEEHYGCIYRSTNQVMYAHSKCSTCGSNIKGQGRHCPDIAQVKRHFEAKCDIDLQILPGDFICTPCYNTHLDIIHQGSHISHDSDLEELVRSHPKPTATHIYTEVNERSHSMEVATHSMIMAVGKILIKKLAILFPDIYTTFIQEIMKILKLPKENTHSLKGEIPRKWIFSRLVNFFGHHLRYICKSRSCGVLLYRCGADLEVCLTKSLKLFQGTGLSFLALASEHESEEGIANCAMESVCSEINSTMHAQIAQTLKDDASFPYDISKFNVDDAVSRIDPKLWKTVALLTQTVTEKRNGTDPSKLSKRRKLHCLYCICVMLFATNRCCSVPIHVLLTDVMHSQGGSHELITMLNRFGAVASVETHRRFVQFQIQKQQKEGLLYDLDLAKFTVVTVDNIDFLQRHAMVYCGDQSRSWHGTSLQVVQPLSSRSVETSPQPTQLPSSPSRPQIQPIQPTEPVHKKITRRARSTTEYQKLHDDIPAPVSTQALDLLQTINPLNAISTNQYAPLKDKCSLLDFQLTAVETAELNSLKLSAFFYSLLRYGFLVAL